MRRARTGEQDATAALLQRYREPVFAFVYRVLGSHANAEDVAQEAFVRAFQNLRPRKRPTPPPMPRTS